MSRQPGFPKEMRVDAKAAEKVLVRVQINGVYTKRGGQICAEWLADEDDPQVGHLATTIADKAGVLEKLNTKAPPVPPSDLNERELKVTKEIASALRLYGPNSGRDLWNTLWDAMRELDPEAANYIADTGKLPPHLQEDED